MSSWLKWRLFALFMLALAGSGGAYLHAQDDEQDEEYEITQEVPPAAKTPEEASRNFMALIQSASMISPRRGSEPETAGVASRRSLKQLKDGGAGLFEALVARASRPNYETHVVSNDGQTATTTVVAVEKPETLDVVTIAEDGGWRVDLIATYAKWNNLEGAELASNIFKLTGTVLPGLPASEYETVNRSQCQSNLKQVMLGIMQYAQDYDEKLPPAKKWDDVVQPYVKSHVIFNCPAIKNDERFGYAYNSRLSQKNQGKIDAPAEMVNVYETTNLAMNAYGLGDDLAFRHQDGANYAFADGHVKWFKRGDKPQFTFKP